MTLINLKWQVSKLQAKLKSESGKVSNCTSPLNQLFQQNLADIFDYSTALSVQHVTDIEVFLTVQSPSGYVYPIVSRSNAMQRNSDALHRILILHLAYQACSSTGSQFKVAPVVPDLLSMPGVLHHPPPCQSPHELCLMAMSL